MDISYSRHFIKVVQKSVVYRLNFQAAQLYYWVQIHCIATMIKFYTSNLLPQSQIRCFDIYAVRLESVKQSSDRLGLPELIESGWIVPKFNNGKIKFSVNTNSALSTNMFYNATLITAIEMLEAGSFQFCKCDNIECIINHVVKTCITRQ